MSANENYYDVLNLSRDATQIEINKKYKELVKLWHPDKCSDKKVAQQKLAEINKAYQVLGNVIEKKKYDDELEEEESDEKEEDGKVTNKEFINYYNQVMNADTESLFSSSSSTESSMDMHKFKKQLRELNAEMERNGMPWEKINTDFDSNVEFHDSENDPILDTPYKQKLYELIAGEMKKTKGSTLNFDLYLTLEDLHRAKDRTIVIQRKTSQFNYEPHAFAFPIRRNMYDGEQIPIDYAGHYVDEYGILTREAGICMVHVHIVTHEIFTKIGSNLYATFEISLDEAKNGFERNLTDLDGNIHNVKVNKLERSDYMYVLRGCGIKKFDGFMGDIYVNFAVRITTNKNKIDVNPIKKSNPNKKPIVQQNVMTKKLSEMFIHKKLERKNKSKAKKEAEKAAKEKKQSKIFKAISSDSSELVDSIDSVDSEPSVKLIETEKKEKPKKGRPSKTKEKLDSNMSESEDEKLIKKTKPKPNKK